ncbi:hypothetical protein ACF1AB_39195 [Streptomyces sp. NPDC014846]|uniref:hypothetical protein n=1 Tax=Streptomyces sp. NPDC014846 TaxID=3364922 RepID=UPI0037026936
MTARAALRVLGAEGLVDVVPGRGSFVADPLPRTRELVSGETADDTRILALEDTLRDVLGHIRPQGNPNWELNACLVTNDQLNQWWATLDTSRQHTSSR